MNKLSDSPKLRVRPIFVHVGDRAGRAFRSDTVASRRSPRALSRKRLQVNGPVDLEVLTHSGDVTVRAGSTGIGSDSRKDLCWAITG